MLIKKQRGSKADKPLCPKKRPLSKVLEKCLKEMKAIQRLDLTKVIKPWYNFELTDEVCTVQRLSQETYNPEDVCPNDEFFINRMSVDLYINDLRTGKIRLRPPIRPQSDELEDKSSDEEIEAAKPLKKRQRTNQQQRGSGTLFST